jgi:hypothetical protein
LIDINKNYNNIFILESHAFWFQFSEDFDFEKDIVLTFDFRLKMHLESLGGQVFYIDSLCGPDEMQKNNLLAEDFFKKWHYDKYGEDIFKELDVPFGFAFRIEIWSEYLHYVRLRANLNQLKKIKCKKFFLGENKDLLKNVLTDIGLNFYLADKKNTCTIPVYFFDIHKYMFNALHAKSLRNIFKNIMIWTLSNIRFFLDIFVNKGQKIIYAQIYHPTKPIISYLLKDPNLRVVTSSLVTEKGWKKFFFQRLIPIRDRQTFFKKRANNLLTDFRKKHCTQLILNDGTDATDGVYIIIERQIKHRVAEALRILSSTIAYVERYPIHLQLMIANIGMVQTIVDCILLLRPKLWGVAANRLKYIHR